jgi:hypothetical protein
MGWVCWEELPTTAKGVIAGVLLALSYQPGYWGRMDLHAWARPGMLRYAHETADSGTMSYAYTNTIVLVVSGDGALTASEFRLTEG